MDLLFTQVHFYEIHNVAETRRKLLTLLMHQSSIVIW
jgi:hypothetical protein